MSILDKIPVVNLFLSKFKLRFGLLILLIVIAASSIYLLMAIRKGMIIDIPVKYGVNFKHWYSIIIVSWFVMVVPLNAVYTGALQCEQVELLLGIVIFLLAAIIIHYLLFTVAYVVATFLMNIWTNFIRNMVIWGVLELVMVYTLIIANSIRASNET